MKVFVIEDNPVYNDYVCNLLKKDSFDTMSAYILPLPRNYWQSQRWMILSLPTYASPTVKA